MFEFGIAAFIGFFLVGCVVLFVLLKELLGVRYIANDKVGIVEKLWSGSGSIPEGNIIALNGEAGFQADILRGGLHFGAVAVAVQDPQGAAGHDPAEQDRLHLCP